jgi:cellulose synthase/poly-beta-1,6-N-acetylglucosamine synthase-like glycosyltransferase
MNGNKCVETHLNNKNKSVVKKIDYQTKIWVKLWQNFFNFFKFWRIFFSQKKKEYVINIYIFYYFLFIYFFTIMWNYAPQKKKG